MDERGACMTMTDERRAAIIGAMKNITLSYMPPWATQGIVLLMMLVCEYIFVCVCVCVCVCICMYMYVCVCFSMDG